MGLRELLYQVEAEHEKEKTELNQKCDDYFSKVQTLQGAYKQKIEELEGSELRKRQWVEQAEEFKKKNKVLKKKKEDQKKEIDDLKEENENLKKEIEASKKKPPTRDVSTQTTSSKEEDIQVAIQALVDEAVGNCRKVMKREMEESKKTAKQAGRDEVEPSNVAPCDGDAPSVSGGRPASPTDEGPSKKKRRSEEPPVVTQSLRDVLSRDLSRQQLTSLGHHACEQLDRQLVIYLAPLRSDMVTYLLNPALNHLSNRRMKIQKLRALVVRLVDLFEIFSDHIRHQTTLEVSQSRLIPHLPTYNLLHESVNYFLRRVSAPAHVLSRMMSHLPTLLQEVRPTATTCRLLQNMFNAGVWSSFGNDYRSRISSLGSDAKYLLMFCRVISPDHSVLPDSTDMQHYTIYAEHRVRLALYELTSFESDRPLESYQTSDLTHVGPSLTTLTDVLHKYTVPMRQRSPLPSDDEDDATPPSYLNARYLVEGDGTGGYKVSVLVDAGPEEHLLATAQVRATMGAPVHTPNVATTSAQPSPPPTSPVSTASTPPAATPMDTQTSAADTDVPSATAAPETSPAPAQSRSPTPQRHTPPSSPASPPSPEGHEDVSHNDFIDLDVPDDIDGDLNGTRVETPVEDPPASSPSAADGQNSSPPAPAVSDSTLTSSGPGEVGASSSNPVTPTTGEHETAAPSTSTTRVTRATGASNAAQGTASHAATGSTSSSTPSGTASTSSATTSARTRGSSHRRVRDRRYGTHGTTPPTLTTLDSSQLSPFSRALQLNLAARQVAGKPLSRRAASECMVATLRSFSQNPAARVSDRVAAYLRDLNLSDLDRLVHFLRQILPTLSADDQRGFLMWPEFINDKFLEGASGRFEASATSMEVTLARDHARNHAQSLALLRAKCDYVYFLSPETRFQPSLLQHLMNRNVPRTFCTAPLQNHRAGPRLLTCLDKTCLTSGGCLLASSSYLLGVVPCNLVTLHFLSEFFVSICRYGQCRPLFELRDVTDGCVSQREQSTYLRSPLDVNVVVYPPAPSLTSIGQSNHQRTLADCHFASPGVFLRLFFPDEMKQPTHQDYEDYLAESSSLQCLLRLFGFNCSIRKSTGDLLVDCDHLTPNRVDSFRLYVRYLLMADPQHRSNGYHDTPVPDSFPRLPFPSVLLPEGMEGFCGNPRFLERDYLALASTYQTYIQSSAELLALRDPTGTFQRSALDLRTRLGADNPFRHGLRPVETLERLNRVLTSLHDVTNPLSGMLTSVFPAFHAELAPARRCKSKFCISKDCPSNTAGWIRLIRDLRSYRPLEQVSPKLKECTYVGDREARHQKFLPSSVVEATNQVVRSSWPIPLGANRLSPLGRYLCERKGWVLDDVHALLTANMRRVYGVYRVPSKTRRSPTTVPLLTPMAFYDPVEKMLVSLRVPLPMSLNPMYFSLVPTV
ncbi:Oidioi.mRNA.OKI2018_I69.XSR.g13923.t1.cds [Oikopleura dioica]|uniref:Oidioi.mRNA.OKI2018_I69.XSR.g13923.t1.cds n=1 Tax=Oikopleura dioica TaxID=34765 RepID=A0ABN7SDG3_OIKDI|nr:Oidioi.mRNA.OKI2018_I69.XSR.g13923.t1.cds [Oikopleura dioica]